MTVHDDDFPYSSASLMSSFVLRISSFKMPSTASNRTRLSLYTFLRVKLVSITELYVIGQFESISQIAQCVFTHIERLLYGKQSQKMSQKPVKIVTFRYQVIVSSKKVTKNVTKNC